MRKSEVKRLIPFSLLLVICFTIIMKDQTINMFRNLDDRLENAEAFSLFDKVSHTSQKKSFDDPFRPSTENHKTKSDHEEVILSKKDTNNSSKDYSPSTTRQVQSSAKNTATHQVFHAKRINSTTSQKVLKARKVSKKSPASKPKKSLIKRRRPAAFNKNAVYVSKLERLVFGQLDQVGDVKSPVTGAVNVGTIIVNPKKTDQLDPWFENKTKKSFGMIFDRASATVPLHFVLVTDEFSRQQAGRLIVSIISKRLTLTVIQNVYKKKLTGLPSLYFSLVDYQQIKAKKPKFVDGFRGLNGTDPGGKYNQDFFFIAPLYHLAFTSLQRLIVIDCQDLEFHTDISELEAQFYHFKSKNILGVGLDLSPHYWEHLKKYRETHPGTEIGEAGRFQGFNTGVVLYDFERMRKSEEYNRYLEPGMMLKLMETYIYTPLLAEQDWFTNLGFLHPNLFYVLPCVYNAQTTIEYMREDLVDIFDDYHFCDKFQNLKIVHYNGCGSEPINCGHGGDPEKHKTKKYKDGMYIPPNIEGLDWMFFEKIRKGEIKFNFHR